MRQPGWREGCQSADVCAHGAAHHDYRAVLAQVLRGTFGLPDSAMAGVLPGARWDTRLDGLLRKT